MIKKIQIILSFPVLFVFLVSGWATAAPAAEIVVKGRELEGSVVGFTAEGVEFETVYGTGSIVIPWDSTESLSTETEFVVLYSDEKLAIGRVWGFKDGELLVGDSLETAVHIPVSLIIRSLTREKYETSRLEALRVRYRFWNANFDLAWAYTDATTKTNSFALGLEFMRKKKPTELFLAAYYRYATTKNQGEATVKTEDRFYVPGRLDYDFSDRLYGFGAVSYERDEIQGIKIRTDPNIGLGYRFVKQDNLSIAGRIGPGYVYQKYFEGGTDDYFTILFGGDLDANLPYDSKLRVRLTYMPSVSDWTDNYLLRGSLDWTAPIIGMLDFKFSIFDTYNSKPAPNTRNNSFTTTVGFSFRF
jgi:putative salt-induced outer membrane protein YdiY